MGIIRIEKIGDINFKYPYLEVFKEKEKNPFLEIGIKDNKQLFFKYHAYSSGVVLSLEEWGYLLEEAQNFLKTVIEDEENFENWMNNID